MKLTLSEQPLQIIQHHAETAYPNECCGFLFGRDGDIRKITEAKRVKNQKAGEREDRFEIDSADYREAEKYANKQNLDFLGVYHSHPDHPAEPSEHDLASAMPYFSYIIISVSEGKASDIRSWRLDDQRIFKEEALKIKEHSTEPTKS